MSRGIFDNINLHPRNLSKSRFFSSYRFQSHLSFLKIFLLYWIRFVLSLTKKKSAVTRSPSVSISARHLRLWLFLLRSFPYRNAVCLATPMGRRREEKQRFLAGLSYELSPAARRPVQTYPNGILLARSLHRTFLSGIMGQTWKWGWGLCSASTGLCAAPSTSTG